MNTSLAAESVTERRVVTTRPVLGISAMLTHGIPSLAQKRSSLVGGVRPISKSAMWSKRTHSQLQGSSKGPLLVDVPSLAAGLLLLVCRECSTKRDAGKSSGCCGTRRPRIARPRTSWRSWLTPSKTSLTSSKLLSKPATSTTFHSQSRFSDASSSFLSAERVFSTCSAAFSYLMSNSSGSPGPSSAE